MIHPNRSARIEKRWMTSEEASDPPFTYLKSTIHDHQTYPVGLSVPHQLTPDVIITEEREAVLQYYDRARIKPRYPWSPEEVCPIYEAPERFAAYVNKCCVDLTNGGRDIELNVDHWLYPGFYIEDGHVVAAMMRSIINPPAQFPWSRLLALDISGYAENFPLEVTNLTMLKLLKANSHYILPPEIGNLSALRALTLEDSKLTSLPDEFCNLHSLIYLNLDNCGLENLPMNFGKLKSLRALRLYRNRLLSLPESFGQLRHLQVLDLSSNLLAILPVNFDLGKARAIDWVLLDNNRFSVMKLATTLVQEGWLSATETEQLLHDATPVVRQFLENYLPPEHPVLIALAERWAVDIHHGSDHFQILL